MKKRLKKKQQKRQIQQQKQEKINKVVEGKGNTRQAKKAVKHLTKKELEIQYNTQVKKEQKERQRKEKYSKSVELTQWKRQQLLNQGYPLEKLTTKFLRHVKKSDIENNTMTRAKYPELFGLKKDFDYDKVYKFKDKLFLAFRDLTGERSLSEILAEFERFSNETLIDFLESIVNQKMTYSKTVKGSNSSGRAGEVLFTMGNQTFVEIYTDNARRENKNVKRYKSKKKWQKAPITSEYQILKSGRFNSIQSSTPRNLLIVANAIMYNIKETDRVDFYQSFYGGVSRNIPEMREILPKPQTY